MIKNICVQLLATVVTPCWLALALSALLLSACDESVGVPSVDVPKAVTGVPVAAKVREPIEAWEGRARFKRDLIKRYGHARYLNLFAAQIWQESNWQNDAVSWVGAFGCGQFMEPTQGDAKYWARDLGHIDWSNCEQNSRASIRYMRAIYLRIKPPQNIPDNFNFECYAYREAVKDYNRGMGHGDKERRLGYCVRNDAACDETEQYHTRIFGKHQRKFHAIEYGENIVCSTPEVYP